MNSNQNNTLFVSGKFPTLLDSGDTDNTEKQDSAQAQTTSDRQLYKAEVTNADVGEAQLHAHEDTANDVHIEISHTLDG